MLEILVIPILDLGIMRVELTFPINSELKPDNAISVLKQLFSGDEAFIKSIEEINKSNMKKIIVNVGLSDRILNSLPADKIDMFVEEFRKRLSQSLILMLS